MTEEIQGMSGEQQQTIIARIDFGNGRMGFERCRGADGVELSDVAGFLREAMRQVA